MRLYSPAIGVVFVIATFLFDADPKTKTIVMLADNKAKKNAIVVTSNDEKILIDKPNNYVTVGNKDFKKLQFMDEAQREEIFGELIVKPKNEFTIFFEVGSDEITKTSQKHVPTIIQALKERKKVSKIYVSGYTDTAGTNEYNKNLSKKRITKVIKGLIDIAAVKTDEIIEVPYGEEKLEINTPDDIYEARNRKVVIKIK